jgi:hypothetical protein
MMSSGLSPGPGLFPLAPGMSLVTLGDVHAHLNIPVTDTSNDVELQGFIDAATDLIPYDTGPILPTVFLNEVHNEAAGRNAIVLYNSPVISVESVTEYVGPQVRTLTSQPLGSAGYDNYGFSLDDNYQGILYRRLGSGTLGSFFGYVVVNYTAGYVSIPPGIRMAVLEDIRGLYQQTQLGGRPAFASSGAEDDGWTAGPLNLFPRLDNLLHKYARVQSIA